MGRGAGLVLLLCVTGIGCPGRREADRKEAPSASPAPQVAPSAPEAPKPPPSPFAGLRKKVEDFTVLASACSRAWFTKVDPDRIDRWELAVDVPGMEQKCDPLLQKYQDLLEEAAFRHPVLDQWLRTAASVTDRYFFLAFRCKKVGVKDKKPYKKMLAQLRDDLVGDVQALEKALEPALALTDRDLETGGDLGNEPRLIWIHGAIHRLPEDFQRWIEGPRKEQAPIWRFGLMTSNLVAQKALPALSAPKWQVPEATVAAAKGLVEAFSAAWQFYKGDYFEAEEQQAPGLYKAFHKAEAAWKKASQKTWPAFGKPVMEQRTAD